MTHKGSVWHSSFRLLLPFIATLFGTILVSCSSIIVPNPPIVLETNKERPPVSSVNYADEIDFFDAFTDTAYEEQQPERSLPDSGLIFRNRVRVLLQRTNQPVVLYVPFASELYHSNAARFSLRGRIEIQRKNVNSATLLYENRSIQIALPCTLSVSSLSYVDFNHLTYRGCIIISSEANNLLQVINILDVEEYLRGVVPLEIGAKNALYLEALKAQAVAARTYTYKRMTESGHRSYDLVATVADQVYGGASAEFRVTDRAIKETEGMVLVDNGTVIDAYYHSTCGGKTANIEDVWKKQPRSYLRSVIDADEHGIPFCKASPSFTWEESWSPQQLSLIFRKSVPEVVKGAYLSEPLAQLVFHNQFVCGRVNECELKTANQSVVCSGDKIRFVFRRTGVGNPILRSARIKIKQFTASKLVLAGSGYGHGVGMCQYGALGRAESGQTFDQILNAYYTGAIISTVKNEVTFVSK